VLDPKVYLRRHFAEQSRAYAFLVDEAHNLPDRAREMFSSGLDGRQIRETARSIKGALPGCARALARLGSAMRKLVRGAQQPEPDHKQFSGEADLFSVTAPVHRNGFHGSRDVVTVKEFPESLRLLVQRAIQEAENWLAQNRSTEFREALLQLFFRLHSFNRTAELYDDQFVTIIDGRDSVGVRLFCLDPSRLLRQALERGKAAIFFSATLTPIEYYRALISGCPEDPLLRLPSPFPPEHMQVLVQDRIRTDFKTRGKTVTEVAEAIGALVEGRAGNYLVYFPSYQYLQSVRDEFTRMFPAVQVLAQRPEMNERDRESFLAAFSEEHRTTLAGFAVMGGIFGEGIDLVGERLIGAAIVGVGLPQLCTERDLIRDYFKEKTGAGFDFAYTFPGMNRVLQATGRVIRSETDRGVVLLLDTRFAEARYRRLFPAHWQSLRVRTPSEIRERFRAFWGDKTQITSAVSPDRIALASPQPQQ
jgi:DNA excision repair protein ERCC-2